MRGVFPPYTTALGKTARWYARAHRERIRGPAVHYALGRAGDILIFAMKAPSPSDPDVRVGLAVLDAYLAGGRPGHAGAYQAYAFLAREVTAPPPPAPRWLKRVGAMFWRGLKTGALRF